MFLRLMFMKYYGDRYCKRLLYFICNEPHLFNLLNFPKPILTFNYNLISINTSEVRVSFNNFVAIYVLSV